MLNNRRKNELNVCYAGEEDLINPNELSSHVSMLDIS
jgi:hypothetical protein